MTLTVKELAGGQGGGADSDDHSVVGLEDYGFQGGIGVADLIHSSSVDGSGTCSPVRPVHTKTPRSAK